MKKNFKSLWDLWDIIKRSKLYIMEVPEREKRNKERGRKLK